MDIESQTTCSYAYSLLMRANKLKTVLSRDCCMACVTPQCPCVFKQPHRQGYSLLFVRTVPVIQSIPTLPYISAIVDSVAERQMFWSVRVCACVCACVCVRVCVCECVRECVSYIYTMHHWSHRDYKDKYM